MIMKMWEELMIGEMVMVTCNTVTSMPSTDQIRTISLRMQSHLIVTHGLEFMRKVMDSPRKTGDPTHLLEMEGIPAGCP